MSQNLQAFLWILAGTAAFVGYLFAGAVRAIAAQVARESGSSRAAMRRLSDIIKADRAAVPCGRWVKVHDEFRIPALGIGVKAQYRWSERR